MSNEWQSLTIDEIKNPSPHSIAMGPFGSDIKTDNFVSSGVPIIRGVNLKAERFHDSDFVFLTEKKADELSGANAFPGDIVFTHRGTLGQVGIIPESSQYPRYIVSQSQMKLTCDTKFVDPFFVYYYFKSSLGQHALLVNTSTTGVPAISRPITSLKSIRILLPPLPEQQAIAHILSSLDDKIELNRQMNETLEGIGRTLFKSWFVDFDPVQAKMESRQPYGMDEETTELFPDGFEDSRLGKIPIGWNIVKLGEVVGINEISITKDFFYKEIEYIDISSVSVGKLEGTTKYALETSPSRAKRLVRSGDTIWSTVRPNRKSYLFIHNPLNNLVVSTGFAVLTPKSIPPTYLYTCVTTDQFVDHLTYSADGSAYPAVLPSRFYDTVILLPSSYILEKFEQIVSPMRSLIFQNNEESQTLSSLRDALLPKLLSGEIRVKDAEKEVEAVL